MTRNDIAWIDLFARYNIVENIRNNGYFQIDSPCINEYRESRLMTKFDHFVNLPEIFRRNNFSILPVTRGSYIIANMNIFHDFEDTTQIPDEQVPPINHIESINFENITTEATAINCAYNLGIINDFMNEPELFPTVSGRMGSGSFNFTVQSNLTNREIFVNNSQIEIDAGYEGHSSLGLIEAKMSLSQDFLIRQLYYPYRTWCNRIRKPVKPIFLIYSNGIFHLYEYRFNGLELYNSIELVKHKKYSIATNIDTQDIQNIMNETCGRFEIEPQMPFPQADSFERVINLCEILNSQEVLTRDDVTTEYDFNQRQTNYYTDAGRYLGLVLKENNNNVVQYKLSPQGQIIFNMAQRARQLKLIELILKHRAFHETMSLYLEEGEEPSKEQIVTIMQESRLYEINSESTYFRRSSTVASWVNWILSNISSC